MVAFIQINHPYGDCIRFTSSFRKLESDTSGFYLDTHIGYFSGGTLQYIDPLSSQTFLIHPAGRHTLKQELKAKLLLKRLLPDILKTLEERLHLAPFSDASLSRLQQLLTDTTKLRGAAQYKPVLAAAMR